MNVDNARIKFVDGSIQDFTVANTKELVDLLESDDWCPPPVGITLYGENGDFYLPWND